LEKDSNWNWLRRAFRLLKGRPEKIQRRNGVKYAEKSGASLEMDIYLPGEDYKGYPLILFVHGGGFSEGRRDDPRYVQFAENLADKGYPVASITYRLTMKGRSFGCDQPAENKIATFRAAAEDIWDATRFLHDNARVFGFMAPPPIVLCGSSAGAEAVLHAAYWPEALLPEGFRYAGNGSGNHRAGMDFGQKCLAHTSFSRHRRSARPFWVGFPPLLSDSCSRLFIAAWQRKYRQAPKRAGETLFALQGP